MRISRRNERARFGATTVLALISGAIAVGAAAAADWPQLRGDAQRTGVASETIKPPLSVLWRFTGGVQGNNLTSPIIVNGTVYFTTRVSAQQGGILYALDTKTGAKRWSFPNDAGLTNGNYFSSSITYDQGKLYVGTSNGTFFIIDAKTGKETAYGPFQLGKRLESAPVVIDNTVYFGSNDGTFYALDTQTGEKRWSRLDTRTRRTMGFSYSAGEAINSSPLNTGDMLLFMASDNQLHGIKQATGNFRWKTRLPYTFLPNGLTSTGNSVLVATGPAIYSILPASGSIRWYRSLPNDILAAPAASDGVIYVGCKEPNGDGGMLFAIKDNGREQWKGSVRLPFAPTGSPVVSGDVIYLSGARGTIMAVDKAEGNVLWTYRLMPSVNRPNTLAPAETSVAAPLAIADGTLYSLSADGTLTAFRSAAPDTSGPLVTELFPRPGSAINGRPPFVVAAKVTDIGSGLNTDSLTGLLDNKEIELIYDDTRSMIFFVTRSTGGIVDRPLEDGRHVFTLRAKDWRGNETEETWSFVVDNTLPARSVVVPNAPRTTPGTKSGTSGRNGTGRNGGSSGRRGG